MGLLILAMAAVMLFGNRFGIEALSNFINPIDTVLRYLFGALCVIYGFFRLYRGVKREY